MQIYNSYSKKYHDERKQALIERGAHFEEKIGYDYDDSDQKIEIYTLIVFD